MSQNIGTLISAAIRPNDSLDRIASAFASEIKGGFHTAATISDRDSIIVERRDWGMMCYVVDDKKTYQLTNGYSDSDITNNNNWKEFSGSGGSGGGSIEWLDSVKSVLFNPPLSPSNGDRYLVGRVPSDIVNWGIYTIPGFVAQWNSGLNRWDITNPKDGTSLRVDDEDNAIYKYEGDWSTGEWKKEKLGQVRSFDATTVNGLSFSATIDPPIISYDRDMVFLTKFLSTNSGLTASLNINNIGDKLIKKASSTGLINLIPNEIDTSYVYSLTYDGNYFQMVKPYGDGVFDIKTYIEPSDYIIVPQYYQYLVYGDLTISGYLENNGNVVIINGGLVLSGGTFSNNGNIVMTSISTGLTTSYNNTDTIQFTYQNTILGPSVSAIIADGSVTQSKLNIINSSSGNVGSLLSWTSSGEFIWVDGSSLAGDGLTANSGILSINVDNGISISDNNLILGGTLSQDTTINANDFNFTISGAENIIFTSSTFDVISDGLVSIDAGVGSVQISGDDDVNIISVDGDISLTALFNLLVSATSSSITINDGRGLVYSNDYSATFVNNSLVTKKYVDDISSNNSIPIYENKLSLSTTGNNQPTGFTLSNIPSDYSRIQIFINGQSQILGNGTSTSVDCYFWNGYSPVLLNNLNIGDELYWNGNYSGFDLTTNDLISVFYET